MVGKPHACHRVAGVFLGHPPEVIHVSGLQVARRVQMSGLEYFAPAYFTQDLGVSKGNAAVLYLVCESAAAFPPLLAAVARFIVRCPW